MASSSSSSSSYRDTLHTTASCNEFDFNNFPDPKHIAFNNPTLLPLEVDSFFTPTWDETSPQNDCLYMQPVKWESPDPKIDYQPLPILPAMVPTHATQQEIFPRDTALSNTQYSNHRSSHSVSSSKSQSVSSPDTIDPSQRKRKSIAELEDEEDEDSNPLVKKTAHNMIEKRYRTNLNDKIAALRDSVPSLRIMSKSARGEDTMDDREELQGLKPAHKLNKATVLSKATEYIYHLEKRNKRLQQEILDHKTRLAAYETLFRSSSTDFNSPQNTVNPFQFSFDYPSPSTPQPVRHQAAIQQSNELQRLNNQNTQNGYQDVPQELYSQYHQQPMRTDGWNSHSYMGKLMIGTMAGLMIMEGFSEAEQNPESPVGRGLFALPSELLDFIRFLFRLPSNITLFGCHTSSLEVFWYFKFIIIFSSILYIILPDLSSTRFNSNRKKVQNALLSAAPSLASPIQVRRQAWLTAIQTVWVPRHNFFLEAVALCLKIAKLSIRNIFGSQAYTYFTGITEQQEAARIKAWSIALDAQLAGGDIEVNKSRLTLTLLASATLPDTPSRLMLKALHIRVLLWEIGNVSFYGYHIFRGLASRLVRWRWKKAMALQDLEVNLKDEADCLPDYLVALLQQDCDNVLNDSIALRAYNLAWNLPTTRNTFPGNDCMDAVIDDFAIRSPLDAVAAWFSSLTLHKAICESLQFKEDDSIGQKSVAYNVDLAIRTAPIGSSVHVRSLVARSILVKEKRGASIAEALQVVGPLDKKFIQSSPPNLINTGASLASLPELKLSLDCATAIAHIERSPLPAFPEKAVHIINTLSPRKLTLLSFLATFKLIEHINRHEYVATSCVDSLEMLAGFLRIWIGGKDGHEISIPLEVKKEKVEYCLSITKRIVCMQDAGYVSMSETSDTNDI